MRGWLHTELMHQERYMLNRVDIRFRLISPKNVFNLMSPDPFQGLKSVITHDQPSNAVLYDNMVFGRIKRLLV